MSSSKNSVSETLKVALIGNPNSGKTTLFNSLTGLNQRTGNFPGVTVDKKTGYCRVSDALLLEIIDLPGTYSLYPKSIDEQVSFDIICNPKSKDYPDVVIVVADASNLKRSLFLATQIIDLKIPCVLALNMMDVAERTGIAIDVKLLEARLGIKAINLNSRKNVGVEELKQFFAQTKIEASHVSIVDSYDISEKEMSLIHQQIKAKNDFASLVNAINSKASSVEQITGSSSQQIETFLQEHHIDVKQLQAKETLKRFDAIGQIIDASVVASPQNKNKSSLTYKLDNILTHRVFGLLIFVFILFLIFQAIFSFSSLPMEWIEMGFAQFSNFLVDILPQSILTDLLVNGVVAGLSGIVIFVPQIAFLFAFIVVLEDTGYMARVSFMMDKLLRKFGLNGRSIIPLIGGVACAVPAIMSARTISSWKERMITIMITPLMSCSARIPVYTLLISLTIPNILVFGFINLQGLVFFLLYFLGALAALMVGLAMKYILKTTEKSFFVMELPLYRLPRLKNVFYTIYEKVKIFLVDAGKVILAISVVLWFLTSFGPGNEFDKIDAKYNTLAATPNTIGIENNIEAKRASEKLEASYAGLIGKKIEPLISPIGFDWKIGISIITSFAAREVFVGTMATIYSANNSEDIQTVRQSMAQEINPKTGEKMYTLAVGASLLLFYAFSMQCMSTMAIVYRETKHWKWPVIQFAYMGVLAYLSSYLAYTFLS